MLTPAGSIYLHCDPTASHYLKLLCDAVFGPSGFRTEITWQRTSSHNDGAQGRKQPGPDMRRDLVLQPGPRVDVEPGVYAVRPAVHRSILPARAAAKGNPHYEVMGVTRYWRYSREQMQAMIDAGRIVQAAPGRVPRHKRYLDEMPGKPLQDLWSDIPPVSPAARERIGYPTQKPIALLNRIIEASSNPGDVVLDPFCGCATACVAADNLQSTYGRDRLPIKACACTCKRTGASYGPRRCTCTVRECLPGCRRR